MRKNQFFTCVCLIFSLWSLVTYYVFLRQPSGTKPYKEPLVDNTVHKFESELKQGFVSNRKLFYSIRQYLYKQVPEFKDSDKSEDTYIPVSKIGNSVYNGEDKIVRPVIAVLVLACNRITVSKCIDQLIRYRPSAQQFPIIVSQDCKHKATATVIASYGNQLSHIEQPDQTEIKVPPKEKKFRGYFNIARHYVWALNETFFKFNYETVIVVEDDLNVAPDFFEYFLGTFPLLQKDPTLWCVSAWNDNGKVGLVDESAHELLYRTDFFPGLGWMLTKATWAELAPKWPVSYWDDWMRKPEQRRNRACIRPEISRTKTFGKVGVSRGYFYENHLKYIKLNERFVHFTESNLEYLLKDNYDLQFVKQVYESKVITYEELENALVNENPVRIRYHTNGIFKENAKMLGLMDDFRSGVPRTGYRGVVSFMYKRRRVYLAPNADWKTYDPSWR